MKIKRGILNKLGKKTGTLTIAILDFLLSSAEGLIKISFSKKEAYKALRGLSENEWTCENISKFLDSLKRRGYIETQKVGESNSLVFTNKAKLSLLESISQKIKTDCKYRYISFDIPENLRRNRNAFRRAIKKLGFAQIQKSLWVIDKNVGELVEIAAYEYGVEKYIIYIISESSDVDGYLKKRLEIDKKSSHN